jgi:hypothetical protein
MVTLVACVTALVTTLNEAPEVNCEITTEAGTLATAGLLLVSVNVVSFDTALSNLTRPLDPAVPVVVDGLSVTASCAWPGATVSLPCTVVPFKLALIVTTVEACTGLVATLTLANQFPDWATTVAGTLATAGSLLERLTTKPSLGAAPDSCAIPDIA